MNIRHPRPHIVFAGGGTCGHLFPGIAVAQQLRRDLPDALITFVGSGRDNERMLVESAGYRYRSVPCRPLAKRPLAALRFVTDNFIGLVAARWMLRETGVSLVVGLGGYASAPIVRAATSAAIPTVLLEQNTIPGRVTRWLAPSANLVCGTYESTRQHLRSSVAVRITGNPVRDSMRRIQGVYQRRKNRSDRRRQLLILGGSGGARRLNEAVPRAICKLGTALDGWQIVHQTGAGGVPGTQQRYEACGREAVVVSFIDNLAEVLAETDLVICRAGGTTLAELALAGMPAVVVPFPLAADDHQRENARLYAAHGACRLLEQQIGPVGLEDRLARLLGPLVRDAQQRQQLSAGMTAMARPHAAREVADTLCEMLMPVAVRLAA